MHHRHVAVALLDVLQTTEDAEDLAVRADDGVVVVELVRLVALAALERVAA